MFQCSEACIWIQTHFIHQLLWRSWLTNVYNMMLDLKASAYMAALLSKEVLNQSSLAWKSPWFMNSFLPGPRIETEITIKDIGYFVSPVDRSYDALGLMKHLSEHNSVAYANAEEILGIKTLEPTKQRCSDDKNRNQENQNPNQPTNFASNILIE